MTLDLRLSMQKIFGHALMGEGAAYAEDGQRIRYNTVGGAGSGLCECGASSRTLFSGAERRRWHRAHKEALLTEGAERTEP